MAATIAKPWQLSLPPGNKANRNAGMALAHDKSMIAMFIPMFGAIGFSLIYLLLGGGLGGAVLIFFVAKMLGK